MLQVTQFLGTPTPYVIVLLIALISAPQQWFIIIRRTLNVLSWFIIVPVIVILATLIGIYEGLNRSDQKKQDDRAILRQRLQYITSGMQLGVRLCLVPFKLLLFIPPIKHNFIAGIHDARKLKNLVTNSQLSPRHRFTMWRPFKSFLLAIPYLFRKGRRRYASRGTRGPSVATASKNATQAKSVPINQPTTPLARSTPPQAASSIAQAVKAAKPNHQYWTSILP